MHANTICTVVARGMEVWHRRLEEGRLGDSGPLTIYKRFGEAHRVSDALAPALQSNVSIVRHQISRRQEASDKCRELTCGDVTDDFEVEEALKVKVATPCSRGGGTQQGLVN